jgi:MtN3 and saliva related transmembrane protein
MGIVPFIGSIAGICTTFAYLPQVLKIRRQGGDDLSYPMLFLYLTGVLLWFVYGLLSHAAAIIWANGITALLVAATIVLKMNYRGSERN